MTKKEKLNTLKKAVGNLKDGSAGCMCHAVYYTDPDRWFRLDPGFGRRMDLDKIQRFLKTVGIVKPKKPYMGGVYWYPTSCAEDIEIRIKLMNKAIRKLKKELK